MHLCDDIQTGFFVDVADKFILEKFRKDFGITSLTDILCTQNAFESTGGNKGLKRMHPKLKIRGTEKDKIAGCTHFVNDGDKFSMLKGKVQVKAYYDEKGHMLYFIDSKNPIEDEDFESEMWNDGGEYMTVSNVNRCLFAGDTLQIGGYSLGTQNNKSTIESILKLSDHLLTLPEDTKIFCSTENTKANFLLAAKADPENEILIDFYEKYKEIINSGKFNVPSVLKDEKEYNPFMRCRTK